MTRPQSRAVKVGDKLKYFYDEVEVLGTVTREDYQLPDVDRVAFPLFKVTFPLGEIHEITYRLLTVPQGRK